NTGDPRQVQRHPSAARVRIEVCLLIAVAPDEEEAATGKESHFNFATAWSVLGISHATGGQQNNDTSCRPPPRHRHFVKEETPLTNAPEMRCACWILPQRK